jgi:cytochrome c6
VKTFVWALALTCSITLVMVFGSFAASGKSGEALFKEHCAACHPDGGNIINPRKTLKKKDLEANKAASAEAIINLMRAPGPGMLKFDAKTLPDKEARSIAEYILKTFSK